MQTRCARRLTAAALAAAALTGCSGGGGAASSKASSPPASPAGAPAPSAATATAAPPSPTPTPTPVRSGPPTQAELAGALLGLADMPTGYAVDTSATAQADRPVASSTLPACSALVGLVNAEKAATATATASVSLDGGADNTSVDESLEAFATRFTATSGDLAGFELLTVASTKDDVLVRGQFFDALPEESEDIMRTAVAKVTKTLGSGNA